MFLCRLLCWRLCGSNYSALPSNFLRGGTVMYYHNYSIYTNRYCAGTHSNACMTKKEFHSIAAANTAAGHLGSFVRSLLYVLRSSHQFFWIQTIEFGLL